MYVDEAGLEREEKDKGAATNIIDHQEEEQINEQ